MKEEQKAVKNDDGKVSYSDLPQLALKSTAKVFNYGAAKYSKFNYSYGMELLRYIDATYRHMHSWIIGEDIDESCNHHIDHAIASLMILRENIHTNRGTDNRNKTYLSKKLKMSDGDFQLPHKHIIEDMPIEYRYQYLDDDSIQADLKKIVIQYPNDADLGKNLRKLINENKVKRQ